MVAYLYYSSHTKEILRERIRKKIKYIVDCADQFQPCLVACNLATKVDDDVVKSIDII